MNDKEKSPIFENEKEEINYYKNKCSQIESEISKYEAQIKKLENANKKLQELVSKNSQNINNTSIAFFLPSEFKNLWDKLIKTELLEAFDFYINEYNLVSNLSQDLFLIMYHETENLIHFKINTILESLNIKTTSTEQMNKIIQKFLPFFQEHLFEIFFLSEDLSKKMKSELVKISSTYTIKVDQTQLMNECNKNQFTMLMKSFFSVCLYMLLHEPVLTLNIKQYSQRVSKYMYYNKKEMIIIEGFPVDQTPCVLILPPPMLRKKFPFNGMKPAFYALSEANSTIINECEKYKKENSGSKSTASTPITNKINNDFIKVGGCKSGTKLENECGFKFVSELMTSKDKKPPLVVEIPSDKEDIEEKENFMKAKKKEVEEIYHQGTIPINKSSRENIPIPHFDNHSINENNNNTSMNMFNKNNISNYYEFKINSERTNSRKKYELPGTNISYLGYSSNPTTNQDSNQKNTNNNDINLTKPNNSSNTYSHVLSFNPSIHPQLIPKKSIYNIPSFNIVRNKDMTKQSRSKDKDSNINNIISNINEINSSNYYQFKKRDSYTPYLNNSPKNGKISLGNDVSQPKTPSKKIYDTMYKGNTSFRYGGYLTNNSSNSSMQYLTSNKYLTNEMKVKELKQKYNIQDEDNKNIDNIVPSDSISPKYKTFSNTNPFSINNTKKYIDNIKYDKYYYKQY